MKRNTENSSIPWFVTAAVENYNNFMQQATQVTPKEEPIDMEKFQKFCNKFQKKLLQRFSQEIVDLSELSSPPKLNDNLFIYCPDEDMMKYSLKELYEMYYQYKNKYHKDKPLKELIAYIENEYSGHDIGFYEEIEHE